VSRIEGVPSFSHSSTDAPDLTQDVRRLFEELARRPDRRGPVSGECSPVLDVLETEQALEILVDVPGMAPDSLRILIKNGIVLVVGEKERAEPSRTPTSYHLVERDFGRFARAVRVHVSVNASEARARLSNGELRIVLPKVVERRGREIRVSIETGQP
jgi:HSP20 family protein